MNKEEKEKEEKFEGPKMVREVRMSIYLHEFEDGVIRRHFNIEGRISPYEVIGLMDVVMDTYRSQVFAKKSDEPAS